MTDAPLVTFFLCAYKQEHFVQEAIAGALAQTYSPLEIILSDDCSPDRTFALMEEAAAAYKGPHKIILNRNSPNLGITGHVNKCVELSSGQMLVGAAGDDISSPRRVERLVQAWAAGGFKAHSIHSNMTLIAEDGRVICDQWGDAGADHALSLEEAVQRCAVGVGGCTHAFTRETFDLFGPLHKNGSIEDHAIAFRSLILFPVLYIAESLVLYRQHESSVKKGSRVRLIRMLESVLKGWLADLVIAQDKRLISPQRVADLSSAINEKLRHIEWECATSKGSLLSAAGTAISLIRNGGRPNQVMQAFYRARAPRWVKGCRKFLTYDLFHPRELAKTLRSLGHN